MISFGRLPLGLLEPHLLHRTTFSNFNVRLGPVSRRYTTSSEPQSTGKVHVRFAPSPTGHLHLGGLRTVLFNHLLARRTGGTWTLRIEDTDRARYVEGAVEGLLKTLEWAKLDFDDGPGKDGGRGPYFQSQRKEIYDRYLQKLIDAGRAYHCFCTPERIATTRKVLQKSGSNSTYDQKCLGVPLEEAVERLGKGESSVVRFKSSPEGLTQNDLVYDAIKYDTLPIEDFVLRKSDGLPTYHFANVVDDHEMGVTHVLRGEEWLPSTPKHLALYAALGLTPPQFAHMPILVNPDGTKLSKRAGDVRVEDYITRGYEPEALLNFVALMGWSPALADGTSEVMTLKELINAVGSSSFKSRLWLTLNPCQFSIEGINKNRATMSPSKLDFLNRSHIQLKVESGNEAGREELASKLRVILSSSGIDTDILTSGYLARVIAALKERIHTIHDVPKLGAYFFTKPNLNTPAAQQLLKSVEPKVYTLRNLLLDAQYFELTRLEAELKKALKPVELEAQSKVEALHALGYAREISMDNLTRGEYKFERMLGKWHTFSENYNEGKRRRAVPLVGDTLPPLIRVTKVPLEIAWITENRPEGSFECIRISSPALSPELSMPPYNLRASSTPPLILCQRLSIAEKVIESGREESTSTNNTLLRIDGHSGGIEPLRRALQAWPGDTAGKESCSPFLAAIREHLEVNDIIPDRDENGRSLVFDLFADELFLVPTKSTAATLAGGERRLDEVGFSLVTANCRSRASLLLRATM
ncbi:glutamyl-tRNA synthetase, partial [Phenoliferia sp. Uapishka_3]